jgi:hypothetical protein
VISYGSPAVVLRNGPSHRSISLSAAPPPQRGLRFEVWPWRLQAAASSSSGGGEEPVLVSLPKAVDACVFYTLGERHLAHDPDRPGTYGSITMIGHPAPSPSPNAFVSAEQRLRDSRILLLISRPARAVGDTSGVSSSPRCARVVAGGGGRR